MTRSPGGTGRPKEMRRYPAYTDYAYGSLEAMRSVTGGITNDPHVPRPRKNGHPMAFPERLHLLLEQAERHGLSSIVCWLPHGRSFRIMDRVRFEQQVLPLYFEQQSVFASFQRQLNSYAILRLNPFDGPRHHLTYYHELLLRGRSDLSTGLIRLQSSAHPVRLRFDERSAPNFDAMSPMPLLGQEQWVNATPRQRTVSMTTASHFVPVVPARNPTHERMAVHETRALSQFGSAVPPHPTYAAPWPASTWHVPMIPATGIPRPIHVPMEAAVPWVERPPIMARGDPSGTERSSTSWAVSSPAGWDHGSTLTRSGALVKHDPVIDCATDTWDTLYDAGATRPVPTDHLNHSDTDASDNDPSDWDSDSVDDLSHYSCGSTASPSPCRIQR